MTSGGNGKVTSFPMRDDRLGRTDKMTRYQMTRGTQRSMTACADEVHFKRVRDIKIGVKG